MKKSLLLIIPIIVLSAVSCGKRNANNTISNGNASQDITEVDQAQEDIKNFVNFLNSDFKLTETRKSVYINKDGKEYYSSYEIKDYDSNHGFSYRFINERGYNDFSIAIQKFNTTKTYYYDGYTSYTSSDDGVYVKRDEQTTNTYLKTGFTFVYTEGYELTQNGSDKILKGIVAKEKISDFYGKAIQGVENIEFEATADDKCISQVVVKYSQNGYEVTQEVKYDTQNKNIELPQVVKQA